MGRVRIGQARNARASPRNLWSTSRRSRFLARRRVPRCSLMNLGTGRKDPNRASIEILSN